MSFSSEGLCKELSQHTTIAGSPGRYIIALSGGLDSSVLAHALATSKDLHGKKLLAVHVDHQLSQDSGSWVAHCENLAASLDIEFSSVRVSVERAAAFGPEAAARTARYAAFAEIVESNDWLLSAHHRDDQAETLLLNLLRGSGPAGIAGIPPLRRFHTGWLVRPLLDVSRTDLLDYAESIDLSWIEDPSNEERAFDRNFLRHRVLPAMLDRWPDAGQRLARSAQLARDAAGLLEQLADHDLQAVASSELRLSVNELRALSVSRQRNVLRRAIQRAGMPPIPASTLHSMVTDLIPARADALPCVCWGGVELRRYRDTLYLLDGLPQAQIEVATVSNAADIPLGPKMGVLTLSRDGRPGLSPALVARGLTLGTRKGGEEIKPIGHRHTRKLKKLLQEESIVPWMREQLPLLMLGQQLLAVGDIWIAAEATVENGYSLTWCDRPELY